MEAKASIQQGDPLPSPEAFFYIQRPGMFSSCHFRSSTSRIGGNCLGIWWDKGSGSRNSKFKLLDMGPMGIIKMG